MNLSELNIGEAGTLPTAQEVVLSKSPKADLARYTNEVLRRAKSDKPRLFVGPVDCLLDVDRKVVIPNDEKRCVEAIVDTILADWQIMDQETGQYAEPAPSPSDADLLELRQIQAENKEEFAAMEKVSVSKVDAFMHSERDNRKSGEMVPLRETVVKNFEYERRSIEASLVKRTHTRLVPIARRVLERFQADCWKFMVQREITERMEAELFGLEYKPSRTWLAAARILMNYEPSKRLPAPHAWVTPESLLAGLVDL